jgi:hypothetical protein
MNIVLMFAADQVPRHTRYMLQGYPFEIFDPDSIYLSTTVFLYDMYGPYQDYVKQHLDQGHRVIYDSKNEHYVNPSKNWVLDEFIAHPGQGMFLISGHEPQSIPGVVIAATPYWYWIIDQVHFGEFKYDQYRWNPTYEFDFFMQMGLSRSDRDVLHEMLRPILRRGLYSYRSQGIFLPGDADPATVPNWQRYTNFDWINQCNLTLVVESNLDDDLITGFSITKNDQWFLCEKTYKPIAYGHPFLQAGTCGNLDYVRQMGFETFSDLWDESYSDLPIYTDRIQAIISIIQSFNPAALLKSSVKEKLRYNQERFFNKSLTLKFLTETITQPILEFADA